MPLRFLLNSSKTCRSPAITLSPIAGDGNGGYLTTLQSKRSPGRSRSCGAGPISVAHGTESCTVRYLNFHSRPRLFTLVGKLAREWLFGAARFGDNCLSVLSFWLISSDKPAVGLRDDMGGCSVGDIKGGPHMSHPTSITDSRKKLADLRRKKVCSGYLSQEFRSRRKASPGRYNWPIAFLVVTTTGRRHCSNWPAWPSLPSLIDGEECHAERVPTSYHWPFLF